MNRSRMMVLAHTLVLGAVGFLPSLAHAQAPRLALAAPSSVYDGGRAHAGTDYAASAPSVSPRPSVRAFRPMPHRTTARSFAPSAYREPGTGRNVYLAKPWLQPLD